MSARYWSIPWATTGDKTPIPNTLQPDGAVSAPIGWGPNYEKEKTEAGYLPVSRTYTNQFAFDVTSGLKDLQDFGAPAYYAEAAPYAINAQVRHLDKIWRSSVTNNNTVPGDPGASWQEVSAAVPSASESVSGIAKLSTSLQAVTGTDDSTIMTPLKVSQRIGSQVQQASESITGISRFATAAEVAAGTANNLSVSPLNLKNSSLGLGQTYKNLTGSRALGTTYTNSSGSPIFVSATVALGVGSTFVLNVNGVNVASETSSGTLVITQCLSAIVPNGAGYYVSISGGTGTLTLWTELSK